LHQVGDLFELNVKLRCQKVNQANIKIIFSPHQLQPFPDTTEFLEA